MLPRSTAVLKGIFAIGAMGMAAYLVFARLYFAEAGLTKSQIGILFSVPGLILLLSQPVWSLISDYWGSARMNLQLMFVGSTLLLLLYYFKADFFLENFLLLVFLMIVFSFFYTGRGPVQNSVALSHLEGKKEEFGEVRLWMSIGWAFSAVIVGIILFERGLDLLFPISAGFFLLTTLLVSCLPPTRRPTLQRINVFRSDKARKVFKNRKMWIFLSCLFLTGIGTRGAMIFLPIYLKEALGFTPFVLGVFYALGALAEVPFFFHGDRLIKSLGIRTFLISGFAVLSACWLLLGIITTPLIAFAIFIVPRSLGYSFLYLGSVLYIDRESPAEVRTIGQSMFMTVFFGCSGIIGSFAGGLISQYFGFSLLYSIGGIIGLISIVILIIYWSV